MEDSLEVQIAKFDKQSHRQHDKLMKQAAEQEAQRKAKEERKKAKERAKRVAEEEAKRLAEEAKKKAEEEAQKRAEFQAQWQATLERKVKEKAKAKVVAKVMRAWIAQNAVQGTKPKPKVCGMELFSSFLLLTYSFDFSNVGQPASVCPTRKYRGGTPHVTDARRVVTARAASYLTMLTL